tara:strand:- start:112 stop:270 length:159 start_codon:yes stop_codon:yes gene_type:complete
MVDISNDWLDDFQNGAQAVDNMLGDFLSDPFGSSEPESATEGAKERGAGGGS